MDKKTYNKTCYDYWHKLQGHAQDVAWLAAVIQNPGRTLTKDSLETFNKCKVEKLTELTKTLNDLTEFIEGILNENYNI
jgi:hypothetical protein